MGTDEPREVDIEELVGVALVGHIHDHGVRQAPGDQAGCLTPCVIAIHQHDEPWGSQQQLHLHVRQSGAQQGDGGDRELGEAEDPPRALTSYLRMK